MKRTITVITLISLLAVSLAHAESRNPIRNEIYAMDTVISLSIYGTNASSATEDIEGEVMRLENLLSVTDPNSQISQINAADDSVEITSEINNLLKDSLLYSIATNGALDITIAPVVQAWGFTEEAHSIPDDDKLQELLACVGTDHVLLSDTHVTLLDQAQIDLGAIAKGYTTDRIAQIMDNNGIDSGLISIGGNAYVHNCKPDGSPWRIALIDPQNTDGYAGVLSLANAFAVTSGGYQRYFERDGMRFHHIIDPSTGYPAQSGLLSVTIITGRGQSGDAYGWDGAMCDALSTALYVMGEERAIEFWRESEFRFDFVLITEDGRMLISSGIEEYFDPDETAGYDYEVVR